MRDVSDRAARAVARSGSRYSTQAEALSRRRGRGRGPRGRRRAVHLDAEPLMPAVDVTWLGYLMAGVGLYYMLLFALSLKVLRRDTEQDVSRRPFMALVVPAHNEELVIEETLSALVRVRYDDFLVLVMNDGSTDRTSEASPFIRGLGSRARRRPVLRRRGPRQGAVSTRLRDRERARRPARSAARRAHCQGNRRRGHGCRRGARRARARGRRRTIRRSARGRRANRRPDPQRPRRPAPSLSGHGVRGSATSRRRLATGSVPWGWGETGSSRGLRRCGRWGDRPGPTA